MKKKWIKIFISLTLLFIIAIPFAFFYVLNNGNPYTKFIANRKVPIYLEEKGYTQNEIIDSHYVEPKYNSNKDFYNGQYMVTFKDEPDVMYYYGITKKGKQIMQFCEKEKESSTGVIDIIETETKHSEKDCAKSF